MLTLGIVNTYDKIKILDAHYRAVARAAPICKAYGFSLALFDFPFKMKKDELVEYVVEKTTIGESGYYLQQLNEKGHFFVHELPKKGFPSHFGKLVATTSRPEPSFKITPFEMADEILMCKSFLFLVGLGRKGLPRNLIKRASLHLDITNEGISCETCTAISAIPAHLMGIVYAKQSSQNTFNRCERDCF
ncbi:DUF531 domain-containing protein [Methanohalophilus sp.]|uniref:DUF531 domain-containing protein n=1 Tax=Methanohalophilus sp. TaxID=1966352 RepID=UPI0026102E2C|nr:DUF531 domain-containing protein [Methanohalophilus sp.]MDK2891730.1 uncharacterized protein [Methanohalophilus sp.]